MDGTGEGNPAAKFLILHGISIQIRKKTGTRYKREEEQQMREYQELEESARILYETLAGSGEGFEASYNAKGNLYVLLPSGETPAFHYL